MSEQIQGQKEVELFRAIKIRDIEERDVLHGTSDPKSKMYYSLLGRDSSLFDSWSPSKDGKSV